jgi:hypothetical protein
MQTPSLEFDVNGVNFVGPKDRGYASKLFPHLGFGTVAIIVCNGATFVNAR